VTVAGNLKFDVKPPADSLEKGLQLRKLLDEKRTKFLAASTREGEEALILDAVKGLDVLTVIVPRHPQRFNEVAALLEARGVSYERKSQLEYIALEANIHADSMPMVILGDTMGELFAYYAACDFTFIGGSLLKFGGQNLIEAASMGKPILIGPHTFNFAEATKNAMDAGAAILVNDAQELREKIQYLQQDITQRERMHNAALAFSQTSSGATTRTIPLIKKYLS
jgi:3-deoxy-D-manno-octulosonic-acid transferase